MSFRRGVQLAGFARAHLGRMRRGRREVMTHLAGPRPENLPMPTFVQLRTGEKAWKFREKLAREPLPICNRCCGSYMYGKWQRPTPVAGA